MLPPRRVLLVLIVLAAAASAAAAPTFAPKATLLIDRPNGLGALPPLADGNADSRAHAVSATGRYVVFESSADDLLMSTSRHVFVRDNQTGAVTLLDRAGPGGAAGDRDAYDASISTDGSHACFTSEAGNLVSGASGSHVYEVTIATGAIVLIDRSTSDAIGNSFGDECAIDGDGGFVAFTTNSTNLSAADSDNTQDIYVRNVASGITTLVDSYSGTKGNIGASEPAIDADGQRIAFTTVSTNLNGVGGDTNGAQDIYLRNLAGAITIPISRATGAGALGDHDSRDASISDDGNLVAFSSEAANLGDGDLNSQADVHLRNISGATTTLISRADGASGAIGNSGSFAPAIAGNGSAVAFGSGASNFGVTPPLGEEGPAALLWMRTIATGHTTLVSRASGATGAPTDSDNNRPSLSQDAGHIVWTSYAGNLDPLATGLFGEVFQRDLSGGFPTYLVSRPQDASTRPAPADGTEDSSRSVSADGRFVVFVQRGAAFDTAQHEWEIFVRDTLLGTTTLVSRATGADGGPANAVSAQPSISADGTHVAFVSAATNLTGDAINGNPQIFVRDLVANTTTLASRGASGVGDGASGNPFLSQDGSKVAFSSWAGNLVSGDGNGNSDVFVHDLAAGTTVRASLTVTAGEVDSPSYVDAISADGTRILFSAYGHVGAGDDDGHTHAYVRDLAAGTTTLVDRSADGQPSTSYVNDPVMSADGTRVAFESGGKLTPEAQDGHPDVFVRDLAAGTTVMASTNPDGHESNDQAFLPGISYDGNAVAFFTRATNQPSGATTGELYLRDLHAGTTTLVSARDGGDVPADKGGEDVSLNVDGSCVGFLSSDGTLTSPTWGGHDYEHLYLRVMARECPLVAPETSITSGPLTGKVHVAKVAFGFASDEPGSTFACQLDAASVPCGATYTTPLLADGVHRVTVAATDASGNTDATPALATFTVGVPPALTKLKMTHRRFRVGRKRTALAARTATGTAFRYTLDDAATVRIQIDRRRGKHRKLLVLKRREKAGRHSVAFSGRWGRRHRLARGAYTAIVTATDAGGNASPARRLKFSVVGASR
jgi:Tol biopolymer transport system component